ncbi:probable rRNA-processing protein EBP2 [Diadema antillarum]|uniref:probable rRNA-processing protein EBP2 n=1 Tax=Diadema antillarum TaxID=105358 RepID=UPI003A89FF14
MTHLDHDEGSDFEDIDSDEELQAAFSRGELKPGLNYETVAKKKHINDEDGLANKLADFKRDLVWLERLDVTCGPVTTLGERSEGGDEGENDDTDEAHDDFKRELRIYRQAQAAVLEALPRLQDLNIPTRRPDDYFAEMAKSDEHMRKVREKLISKQLSMERSEKAKKLRELRKFGKKVQQEVLMKRQKEKKELAESVKRFKKGQTKDLGFLEGKAKGAAGGKSDKNAAKGPNPKRLAKNSKFGYGGKRKGSKVNSRESSRDEDDHFSQRRNKSDIRKHQKQFGSKARKGGKGGKQRRPGKKNRQKLKSRRK